MRQTRTNTRACLSTLALGVALSLSACGDDDSPGPSGQMDGSTALPDSGVQADASVGKGPLWVVATNFVTADQSESYLVTTSSLAAGAALDPTRGPKLLGSVIPRAYAGAVYVTDANKIARYTVNDKDELTRSAELQVPGVTDLQSWHLWIVDATKGYVFDPAGLRLILWNPSTMTLTGKQIDLPQIARSGWTPNLVLEDVGPSKRGTQLLIPLSWTDQDSNSRYASGLLVLDSASDSVVAVAESTRCGESYATLEASNGDVWLFPPTWSSAPHYFFDNHKPTCVLRVPAGQTAFDEASALDLSKLGTNSASAGAMSDGATGFYFSAANEAAWDNGKNEGGAFWEIWHYDFVTTKSEKVDGLPLWAGELYYVDVGDELLVPYWEETSTGQRTTLYKLQAGMPPSPRLSFSASWYGVAKLR